MGSAKPLLRLRGETLLARAVRAARGGGADAIFVVAGGPDESAREGVVREARATGADAIVNPAWREGVSTSIRAGLGAVRGDPKMDGAIFLAADQPFVQAEDLLRLVSAWDRGALAAADYGNGVIGIPAIFSRVHFAALDRLTGDAGARRILESEKSAVRRVPMPSAAIDVDLPEEARRRGIV